MTKERLCHALATRRRIFGTRGNTRIMPRAYTKGRPSALQILVFDVSAADQSRSIALILHGQPATSGQTAKYLAKHTWKPFRSKRWFRGMQKMYDCPLRSGKPSRVNQEVPWVSKGSQHYPSWTPDAAECDPTPLRSE